MRKKPFEAPPFVVWRVADRKLKGRFHFRLAPLVYFAACWGRPRGSG